MASCSLLSTICGRFRQNAILALDLDTRATLQAQGEPIAVAVGLRSQTPSERKKTLQAIAELPSRDAKVEFTSRVNQQRRAGVPIEGAISIAKTARAADPERTRAAASGGRPRDLVFPFEWAEAGGSWRCDVHPGALATTRLASKRAVSLEEWRDALLADIHALRNASIDLAGTPRREWLHVASTLQYPMSRDDASELDVASAK